MKYLWPYSVGQCPAGKEWPRFFTQSGELESDQALIRHSLTWLVISGHKNFPFSIFLLATPSQ